MDCGLGGAPDEAMKQGQAPVKHTAFKGHRGHGRKPLCVHCTQRSRSPTQCSKTKQK